MRAITGTGSGDYTTLPVGTIFYIDASENGTEYTELGSAATTASGYNAETAFDIDFDDTTAKYWRVRTNYTAHPIGMAPPYGVYYMTLNRKDPYIKFTTPPAEGDIITMDVDMDVIMKNSNFVVDVECKIQFNL